MTTDQRHERNDTDESHEDHYTYLCDVPSLQEVASHEVVREIWHINLSKYHPIKDEETNVIPCNEFLEYCDEYRCQQLTKQMIADLKDARVEETLKNALKKFSEEITNWVEHLLQIVFRHECLRGSHEIRSIDPKWCIWSVYGKIDYEKSARKILQIGSLTDVQKFLIMCEYCMEDDINNFSLDLLPSEFIEKVDFRTHRSSFYWICFLKNELHRMPVENPVFADLIMPVEIAHFSASILKHWSPQIHPDGRFSNEFFWHRLSNDDRVKVAAAWICYGRYEDFTYVARILSAMLWHQQQRVLSELPEKPSKAIARTLRCEPRIALWIWKHFKDEMAVEQFRQLFFDMIHDGISMSTLLEIWKTASDHQRNFSISNISEEFIDSFSQGHFMVPYWFITGTFRTKRNFMLQKTMTQDVMPWHDPDLLNNLLNNCPPCSDDELTLTKLGIDTFRFLRHLYVDLFCPRNFEKFDDELKAYFLHDVDAARAYKRSFLYAIFPKFPVRLGIYTNANWWDEFCNFIEDAFENDEAGALEVKQRFIDENAHFSLDSQSYFDLRRGFDNLVKIVESMFQNNKLRRVKYSFSRSFDYSKSKCSFVHFDEKFNSKFEQWCSVVYDDSILFSSDDEFLSDDESTSDEGEEDWVFVENEDIRIMD
ncbi:uncharacterized protein LOC135845857 [Planococcus citri]|uniref:uncharacterized protein LOC135845857 n=1 Tax=Planococcus citri TaxID=170843 RepID=UPI0031F8ED11